MRGLRSAGYHKKILKHGCLSKSNVCIKAASVQAKSYRASLKCFIGGMNALNFD